MSCPALRRCPVSLFCLPVNHQILLIVLQTNNQIPTYTSLHQYSPWGTISFGERVSTTFACRKSELRGITYISHSSKYLSDTTVNSLIISTFRIIFGAVWPVLCGVTVNAPKTNKHYLPLRVQISRSLFFLKLGI